MKNEVKIKKIKTFNTTFKMYKLIKIKKTCSQVNLQSLLNLV